MSFAEPFDRHKFLKHVQSCRNEAAEQMHDESLSPEERAAATDLFRRGGDTIAESAARLKSD